MRHTVALLQLLNQYLFIYASRREGEASAEPCIKDAPHGGVTTFEDIPLLNRNHNRTHNPDLELNPRDYEHDQD